MLFDMGVYLKKYFGFFNEYVPVRGKQVRSFFFVVYVGLHNLSG